MGAPPTMKRLIDVTGRSGSTALDAGEHGRHAGADADPVAIDETPVIGDDLRVAEAARRGNENARGVEQRHQPDLKRAAGMKQRQAGDDRLAGRRAFASAARHRSWRRTSPRCAARVSEARWCRRCAGARRSALRGFRAPAPANGCGGCAAAIVSKSSLPSIGASAPKLSKRRCGSAACTRLSLSTSSGPSSKRRCINSTLAPLALRIRTSASASRK